MFHDSFLCLSFVLFISVAFEVFFHGSVRMKVVRKEKAVSFLCVCVANTLGAVCVGSSSCVGCCGSDCEEYQLVTSSLHYWDGGQCCVQHLGVYSKSSHVTVYPVMYHSEEFKVFTLLCCLVTIISQG